MGYVKVFDTITRSSIWKEDAETRIIWITLLLLCNKDGFVRGADSMLAYTARVTDKKFSEAIHKFQSPDPESGTPDNEGRRVEKVPGGYQVLNYDKYREMMDVDTITEYWRVKKQESRERQKVKPPKQNPTPDEIAHLKAEMKKAKAEEASEDGGGM
jgi:isopenicillin N synthase-like dioxygenase